MASFSIAANGDDGFWYGFTFNNGDSDIELGDDGNSKNAFFRFPNVTIPQGYTIDSAIIRLKARWNASNTTCNLNCYFNNIDNAVAPVNTTEADGLSLTGAVAWSGVTAWTGDSFYDSPELKTALQTVIDRGGWSSGNALMVLLKDNSSSSNAFRRTYSYEYSGSGAAAELIVTYSDSSQCETSESFSMSDVVEVNWVAQGAISESFSSNDYAGIPIDVIIEEAFSSDDSVTAVKTFTVTVEEGFSSDDAVSVNWNAQGAIAESLSLDDAVSVNWNAICDIIDSMSLDDSISTTHSNVYGRFRTVISKTGNTLQLKIQNDTEGQSLWLQDLILQLYQHEKIIQNQKPVNIQSQNIRLKIQNNATGETLVLYDNRFGIYVDEQR